MIKKDNQQICVVLPKEVVEQLDALADYEFRTRSQLAAKIIIEYLQTVDFNKIKGD